MIILHKFGQLLLWKIGQKLLQNGARFTIKWLDGRAKVCIKHFNELFLLRTNVNPSNFISNHLEFS